MSLLTLGKAWSRQALLRHAPGFIHTEKTSAWIEETASTACCARAACGHIVFVDERRAMAPLFGGKVVCSLNCLNLLLEAEATRGIQRPAGEKDYQHRMPLGLLMLQRKWITHRQLTTALSLQKKEGYGRLGEWLLATGAIDEALLAKAIALQWGVPVLLHQEISTEAARLLPRLLIEFFEILPARLAAGHLLYLAVDQHVDINLNVAIERMTGTRVEPVVMAWSSFRSLQSSLLSSCSGDGRLFRSATLDDLRAAIASITAESGISSIQIARIKPYIWLRILKKNSQEPMELDNLVQNKVEDVFLLCPNLNKTTPASHTSGKVRERKESGNDNGTIAAI